MRFRGAEPSCVVPNDLFAEKLAAKRLIKESSTPAFRFGNTLNEDTSDFAQDAVDFSYLLSELGVWINERAGVSVGVGANAYRKERELTGLRLIAGDDFVIGRCVQVGEIDGAVRDGPECLRAGTDDHVISANLGHRVICRPVLATTAARLLPAGPTLHPIGKYVGSWALPLELNTRTSSVTLAQELLRFWAQVALPSCLP